LPVHEWSVVFDPTNTAHKAWWWDMNLGSATMGLHIALAERRMVPAWADVSYKQLTWALTGNGNPYVASVVEGMDPGTAFAKDKRTTQVISNEGNLKVRMEYPDGTSTTELRKYEQGGDGVYALRLFADWESIAGVDAISGERFADAMDDLRL
jgi:hypothetical protein